jgi:hypothetical protein
MRVWRAANPEKARKISREYAAKRRELDPEGERIAMFAARYKLSREQAEEVLATKTEACAICHRTDRRIDYDHCHITNRHRGWLCDRCNLGLGHFNESPALLKQAANYLEQE